MVCTLIICAPGRLRQEIVSPRLVWVTQGDPVSKNKKIVHSRDVYINMERHSVLITSKLHNVVV